MIVDEDRGERDVAEALGNRLTRIVASPERLPDRASALLTTLRTVVPFEAAWLAFADPMSGAYVTAASVDLDQGTVDLLGGPAMARHIADTGADGDGPPRSRSAPSLPRAAATASTNDAMLGPAGFRGSLSVALYVPGRRHVGFLMLLSRSASPASPTRRRRLAALAPLMALGIDPMPSLLAMSRQVRGVTAGTVLRSDGLTQPLVGFDAHSLLTDDSPVLRIARHRLEDGIRRSSFLWPLSGAGGTFGHVQITVLAAPSDVPAALAGTVLVSPPSDLHDLTPRELEVLGLVVAGCSNNEIADALTVAPRTVAAHLEHVLVKLSVRTRTLAAVRADREGVYVPVVPDDS